VVLYHSVIAVWITKEAELPPNGREERSQAHEAQLITLGVQGRNSAADK
jgi:hypothetical protein